MSPNPKFTYFPFLKTRSGEVTALERLTPNAQARVFPVFNVVESPKSSFHIKLVQIWAGKRAALDGIYNFNIKGNIADFGALFTALGTGGISIAPCVEVGGPPAYTAAVAPFVNIYSSGLVLRSTPANLPNASQFASQNGWAPIDIDLVIDLGHISEYDAASFAGYLISLLPVVLRQQWRSVTLAGSSAPKDFGGLAYGTTVVPRIEWRIWQIVAAQLPMNFGDYSIAHRDLTEPPGYAMANATVSAKYTVDNDWIMIKGRSTGGQHGQPMGLQYRQHAQALVTRSDFNSLPSCWADNVIAAIAANTHGSGGRPQWVGYGHNRHIELICDRLP